MADPKVTIDQLPDMGVANGTGLLAVQDAGTTKKLALSALAAVTPTPLTDHIVDPTAAHAASAISATPHPVLTGVTVADQLSAADAAIAANATAIGTNTTAIGTNTTNLNAHITDPTDAHMATAIGVSPAVAGGATAQAALAALAARFPVPTGGLAGQVLTKNTNANGDTVWQGNNPVPNGGSAGQFLMKNGPTDGDSVWITAPPIPPGGVAGQVLTKITNTDYDSNWITPTPPSGGGSLPAGGTTGQVLSKLSNTDGDAGWAAPSGLPAGGAAGQYLIKNSATAGDATWKAPTLSIVTQNGSFTVSLANAGQFILNGNGSDCAVNIPDNTTVAFPVGTKIDVTRTSTGRVQITGSAGVTINSAAGATPYCRLQYSCVSLIKVATNTWHVVGDVSLT